MYLIEKFEKRELGIKHPRSFEKKFINEKLISGVATQKVDDDFRKVTILVSVLYDLLKIYGYGNKRFLSKQQEPVHKIKTIKDKTKLINRYYQYVKKAGFGSWKDLFKYKINAFFSYVMEQEIPPIPKGLEEFPDLIDPSFMFYGRAKRFLFILRTDRGNLESFAQSIAQSKKGAPPVHEDVVYDAEVKCFEHLTSEHPNMDNFELEMGNFFYGVNQTAIEFQLDRTIDEIFCTERLLLSDITKPVIPSTSSQYNYSRNGMGAVGAFKSNQPLMRAFYEGKMRDSEPLIKLGLGGVELLEELSELYGQAGRDEQEEFDESPENGFIKETLGLHYDGAKMCNIWKNFIYPVLLEQSILEKPETVVIGLPEPLKVRCITAGPPLTYTVLKPIQKWLWRTLKKLRVFRLIGETVSEEIVEDALGALLTDEEFISGDYKASTDNLHSWVSDRLCQRLFYQIRKNNIDDQEFVPEEYINKIEILVKRALTGHMILHPSVMKEYRQKNLPDFETLVREGLIKEQKEGQLMGSIVSFPFLCLANAALCRHAMEICEFKSFSLVDREIKGYQRCPLLINGDDCVFRGNKMLFEVWKRITAFAGLESSVGKTFRSSKFLTINSCQYKYEISDWEDFSGNAESGCYTELKYVNLGLVYGQKKDGVRGKNFYQIGALSSDLFRTCPRELFTSAAELQLKEAQRIRYRVRYRRELINQHLIGTVKDKDWVQTSRDVLDKVMFEGVERQVVEVVKTSSILFANVPWFLPEWLGGLGIVPWKKEQITEFDTVGAVYIRSHMMDRDIKPMSISEHSQWEMHKFVGDQLTDYKFLENQNFRKVKYDGTCRNLSKDYLKLYKLLLTKVFLEAQSMAPGLKSKRDAVDELRYEYNRENDIHAHNVDEKRLLGFVNPYVYEIEYIKSGYDSTVRYLFNPDDGKANFYKCMLAVKHNRKVWKTVRTLLKDPNSYAICARNLKDVDLRDFSSEKKEFCLSCFDVRPA
jgi:hypothetical protein